MATRNTDINLIIRAKTEGERAISGMADAIEHLVNGAGEGSKEIADLGRGIVALDKAAAGLSTAQDKVGTSAAKQAAAIHTASAGIAEQAERVETLRRGLGILATEADKAFIGPKRNGLADLARLAKSELADAERQLDRNTAAYDRNLAALQTSRSGLLELRRSTAATADAQTSAAAAINLGTQALDEQTAAARRAAAAQQFYNTKGAPALSNGSATDNGASYGALLEHFQRLEVEAARVREAIDPVAVAVERYEARIADVQAAARNGIIGSDDAIIRERQLRFELTQTIDKIAEGATRIRQTRKDAVTEYQALINSVTGVTGSRATENGAGFEALDADRRRREAAVRAREAGDLRAAADRSSGVSRVPATAGTSQNGTNQATYSALNARAIEEEAQALREASLAYERFEARVRSGSAALKDAEAAAERDTATIAGLQARIDPLGTVQRRLNGELERYRELAAAGKISTDELARAEAHLTDEAEQARLALDRAGKAVSRGGTTKAGLFGLKPYELQNLGYQVNDVATQLASGTSLAQTLGQQGGQIIQIFPRITSAIVGAFSNPAFLGAAVVLGGIIIGLKRAADEAERLREFSGEVKFRADGGDYDAKGLSDAAEKLDRMGASADDAKAAVKAFLDEGINPELLDQFGRAAQQTAQRLGGDLPAAAKQVADAFSGGYDAIAEFDNKLNFLTASEREHIRQLFEEGNAQAGRTEALSAYSRQSEAAAAKQRGPWADAAKSLGKAWDALVNWIADTAPIKITIGVLAELAGAVKDVGDAIAAVLGGDKPAAGGAAASAQKIAEVQQHIRDLEKTVTDYEAAITKKSPIAGTLQHVVDITKQQLVTARAELAKLEKSAPDTVNDDPNSAAAKQRTDDLARISVEDELQRLRDAGQSRILSKTEQGRRAQLAGEEAARTVADAVVAAAERRRAVAKETAAIERETDARVKSNQADREKAIRSYLNSIVAAEGGTGPNRAGSSATGAGQFTRGTFVGLYKQINPGSALNDDQIADLRKDSKVALQVLEVFTRQNAKLIERAGKKVDGANLYLLHFLGAGTGGAALRADPKTPINQIIDRVDPNAALVKSQNAAYLRTNGGKGPYRTVGQVLPFLGAKVGENPGSRAQTALITGEADLLEEAKQKQEAFNLTIQHGVEDRQRAVDALRSENGLYGTALLAEQRRQVLLQSELDLRQKVEDANKNQAKGAPAVVVSPEQVQQAQELAAAAFDAAHAREALSAALADVQRPLDDLTTQRDLLREQAEYLRSIGENTQADAIDDQFNALGGKIRDAYDALIAFYKALAPQQRIALGILDQAQLDNIIAKLKVAQTQTQEWGKIAGVSARDIAQAFASSAAQAFTNFINKLAAGKNVFKSLEAGVREFAANFISSVAQMILQLLSFAAAVTILRALGVPIPSGASIFDSVGSKHTGGVVGQDGSQRRNVPSMLFAGAQRFHTGGIIGLAPDELPIIARRGEEVLTEGNPRHRNNIGANDGAAPTGGNTSIFNLFDPNDLAEKILRSPSGDKILINHVRDNQAAYKAALG